MMISTPTSVSLNSINGMTMTSPEIKQMVIDLRTEGNDCFTIARKLELTVPEVEEIVYGPAVTDPDMIELVHWGAHY
jgi:hypothetical protein